MMRSRILFALVIALAALFALLLTLQDPDGAPEVSVAPQSSPCAHPGADGLAANDQFSVNKTAESNNEPAPATGQVVQPPIESEYTPPSEPSFDALSSDNRQRLIEANPTQPFTVTFKGVVKLWPENTPLAGAQIRATSCFGGFYDVRNEELMAQAVRDLFPATPAGMTSTDQSGEFTLTLSVTGIDWGKVRSTIRNQQIPPALEHLSASVVLEASSPPHAATARLFADVSPNEVRDTGETRIHAGQPLRGRVIDSETGEAISGAILSVTQYPEYHAVGLSDALGYVEVAPVSGSVGVMIIASGYAKYGGAVTIEATDSGIGEHRLVRTSAAWGVITGWVVDASTDKVPHDLLLAAIRAGGGRIRGGVGPMELHDDGRFRICFHGAPSFRMYAAAPGYAEFEGDVRNCSPGEHVDVGEIKLTRGKPVNVRVTNSAGNPMKGAVIRVALFRHYDESAGAEPLGETDASGTFQIHMAPGQSLAVRASYDGFQDASQILRETPESGQVDLVLNRHSSITVSVLRDGRHPQEAWVWCVLKAEVEKYRGARVSVVERLLHDDTHRRSVSASGEVLFDTLAPGAYYVFAAMPVAGGDEVAYLARSRLVEYELKVEEAAAVSIDVATEYKLTIQLTYKGQAVSGATVEIPWIQLAENTEPRAESDYRGQVSFDRLPPGRHLVSAKWNDNGTERQASEWIELGPETPAIVAWELEATD